MHVWMYIDWMLSSSVAWVNLSKGKPCTVMTQSGNIGTIKIINSALGSKVHDKHDKKIYI